MVPKSSFDLATAAQAYLREEKVKYYLNLQNGACTSFTVHGCASTFQHHKVRKCATEREYNRTEKKSGTSWQSKNAENWRWRTKHFSFTPHFWNTRDNSGLITLYVHHESIIVKHEFNVAFGMRSRLSISPLAASRKGRPCFISQQDPRFPESASWRCTSSGPR